MGSLGLQIQTPAPPLPVPNPLLLDEEALHDLNDQFLGGVSHWADPSPSFSSVWCLRSEDEKMPPKRRLQH